MTARSEKYEFIGQAQLCVCLLSLLLHPMSALSEQLSRFEIDPISAVGEVNSSVLGSNLKAFQVKDKNGRYGNRGAGVWDPERNVASEVFVDLAKDAGIKVLRWPGGNQARHVRWEQMVGPIEDRPGQLFGLAEFLEFCEQVGATPVMTLPVDANPASAVNLVLYLNGILNSDASDVDNRWVRLRREDGRAEPWSVKWFELGNETYNRSMPVEEYIRHYENYHSAMKAVDPSIMLGAVFEETRSIEDGWARTILDRIGHLIDYVIVHPYLPDLPRQAADKIPPHKVAAAALASSADLEQMLTAYVAAIDSKATGRDIGLAITEFNGNYTLDKPYPYRHTLFNAIHIADMLRVFLKPEHKVLFANQWLFANEHWGMVYGGLGENDRIRKQGIYYIYELYRQFLGDLVVRSRIDTDELEFSGSIGIMPRSKRRSTRPAADDTVQAGKWKTRWFLEGQQYVENDVLHVEFNKNKDINYYHAFRAIEVEPDTSYLISAQIRAHDLQGGKVGIAVSDARGWKHTFHQESKLYITGTTGWQTATVRFHTDRDARKIRVMARRLAGDGIISGRVEFGKIVVRRESYSSGAMPAVTGIATIDCTEQHVYALLLNKDMKHERVVEIGIAGDRVYSFESGAIVTGDSYLAHNYAGGDEGIRYEHVSIGPLGKNRFGVRIPPVSAVGLAFARQRIAP
ncbi:MAG: hypothetical protein OER80_02370 [Gammaproteobacteria bacterium]|nr:hypothetical protein [Gammaproteobacteria bacterium]